MYIIKPLPANHSINKPLCVVTTIHYFLLQQTTISCHNTPLCPVQQSIMSCYNNPLYPVTTNHYLMLQQTIMSCYNNP